MMDFSTLLWNPAALVVFLGCLCCFVTAEEVCYRGDDHIEYDNPCADESGEPARLDLCSRGRRLKGRCKESYCDYCDEGTYQDTFTNCSTCLPCTTAADCLPDQVLIGVCEGDRNAVCGCPPPPPCPSCKSCPTAPPCPSVTPCPVQTECPACECPTNAPVTTGSQEATKLTPLIGECPADILEGPLSGSETKTVRWKEPQATDGATVEQSHHPGDRFFAGNTTVIYVFKTEEHVNVCSFVVTVTEEIFVPTTPSRRDETTENNTPESGSQVDSDFDTWWILLIVLGTLNLILTVCLILNCCRKAPQKGHANGQLQPPINANPEVPQGEYQEHLGPAIPNVYFQDPADCQLQLAIDANPDVPQGECIQMDPLGQTVPPPGNNNLPANGDIGVQDGRASSSDASLELDPPQQNTPPPRNTLYGANGGDSRNAATTSYAGSNSEDDRLHSTDQSPARGAYRLISTDRSADSDVNSNENPMPPAADEATLALGEDAVDSRTPLLSRQLPSSSVRHQRHPEQLILDETKRNSPVLEMEIHWIAAMVYKYFPGQHEILYGRLNITDYAIDKIRLEKLHKNSNKSLEDEIFKIVNYGWLKREGLEQEETRAHLVKQLDTFDKRLAKAYAHYINNCNDFSVMGPVQLEIENL